MQSIGEKITILRKAQGIGQKDLAKRVKCTPGNISALENNRNKSARIPTVEKIAKILKVPFSVFSSDRIIDENYFDSSATLTFETKTKYIPVLGYTDEASWVELLDDIEHVNSDERLPVVDGNTSENAFALIVRGKQMYNPEAKESYPEQMRVVVDPSVNSEDHHDVIAFNKLNKQVLFRKIIEDGEARTLKSISPYFTDVTYINENIDILGVITWVFFDRGNH